MNGMRGYEAIGVRPQNVVGLAAKTNAAGTSQVGKKLAPPPLSAAPKPTPKTVGLQPAEGNLPAHVVCGDPARAAVRGAGQGV
jgi:hypothetical protein